MEPGPNPPLSNINNITFSSFYMIVVLIHLYQPSTTLPSHLSTFVCGGG